MTLKFQVIADGLRVTVGLAFDRFDNLWGVDNGADDLFRSDLGGDIHNDNPADEFNLLLQHESPTLNPTEMPASASPTNTHHPTAPSFNPTQRPSIFLSLQPTISTNRLLSNSSQISSNETISSSNNPTASPNRNGSDASDGISASNHFGYPYCFTQYSQSLAGNRGKRGEV